MSTIQMPEQMVSAMRTASENTPFKPKKPRRSMLRLTTLLGLLVVAAIGFFAVERMRGNNASQAIDYQLAPVKRSTLRVTVTENGNVESAKNEDVKCMVAGGSTILWIVEQGKEVTKGEVLVKLDSSLIEEQLTQQKIAYEKARASRIQAEEDLAVKTIAIREYLEGNYQQQLQTLEANIIIAKENLKSAENSLEHSERMFRKGYINELQLETNRFAVQRSQLDLASAETAKKVLVEFTKTKTVKELESARDTAQAKLAGEKSAEDLEKFKLDRLKEQLVQCVIKAPARGIVIYNNDQGWRNQAALVEEGAKVRESQTLIKLPDLHYMQVKALIHESKVDLIGPGMRALVAVRDGQALGTVISVSSQPEQGRWGASAVKEYATVISIDDAALTGLKPGMTARVEILVKELKDVLIAPLLAVMESGGDHYCWIQSLKGPVKRKVVIGTSNDTEMEIKDGLTDKDVVVLNPRATIAEARELAEVTKTSGKSIPYQPGAPVKAPEVGEKAPMAGGGAPANGNGQGMPKNGAPVSVDGPKKDKGGKDKKKGGPAITLAALDKNGDGFLTKDEVPEQMQGNFDALDSNKDGKVDSKEFNEAMSRIRQQRPDNKRNGPKA